MNNIFAEMLRSLVKNGLQLRREIRTWYWTRKVMKNCESHGANIRANYKTIVNSSTLLGENVHFNGLYIQGSGVVRIGDNFHSGKDCKLFTKFHNYEGIAIPYDDTYVTKSIEIGDNVWLGDRVLILGGNKIGEGAIIQAGSVVVSDIPELGIAGGHPARVFKFRDREHYFSLKKEGKFH